MEQCKNVVSFHDIEYSVQDSALHRALGQLYRYSWETYGRRQVVTNKRTQCTKCGRARVCVWSNSSSSAVTQSRWIRNAMTFGAPGRHVGVLAVRAPMCCELTADALLWPIPNRCRLIADDATPRCQAGRVPSDEAYGKQLSWATNSAKSMWTCGLRRVILYYFTYHEMI